MRSRTHLFTALATALLLLVAPPVHAADGQVNLNTADASQLTLLPRIGPATAERIIAFREENGRFETLEDLMLVRGIGEKTFELLEPWIALEGETTLDEKVSTAAASEEEER